MAQLYNASGNVSTNNTANPASKSKYWQYTATIGGELNVGGSFNPASKSKYWQYAASGSLSLSGAIRFQIGNANQPIPEMALSGSAFCSFAYPIGTTVAGTVSTPTGISFQNHLIYAVNDMAYWFFYSSSSNNTAISCYRSPDGITWTAKTASGALLTSHTLNSDSRNFGVAYKNISGNDVIHISAMATSGTSAGQQHIRGQISNGNITWSAWGTVAVDQVSIAGYSPGGCTPCIDSANRPCDTFEDANVGNPNGIRATNTDSGTAWTAGWGTATQQDTVNNESNASAVFDLGGGNLLMLWENGSATEPNSTDNYNSSLWTGTWSSKVGVLSAALGAGVSPNNAGIVGFNSPGGGANHFKEMHAVIGNGTNTFTHRIWNTAWNNGDAIANQTYSSGNGVFLVSDNLSTLYLFVINGSTILYNQWLPDAYAKGQTVNGWQGWQTYITGVNATFLSGYPTIINDGLNNNRIGLAWTQANGSNFDVWFSPMFVSVSLPQWVGQGSLGLSGTATSSLITASGGTATGSGNIQLSGTSSLFASYLYSGNGNLQLSGISNIVPIYLYNGSGNIMLSGLATTTELLSFVAGGNLLLTGNATENVINWVYVGGGNIALSGNSFEVCRRQFANAGVIGGTSISATWPVATLTGDLLVAIVSYNSTTSAISSPLNWELATSYFNSILSLTVAIYFLPNAQSQSGSVSFNFNQSLNLNLIIVEYDGLAQVPFDPNSTGNNYTPFSATVNSGTSTTSFTNELILCGIATAGNVSYSSPTNNFTIFNQTGEFGNSLASLDLGVALLGSYSTGVTASNSLYNSVAVIIGFSELVNDFIYPASGSLLLSNTASVKPTYLYTGSGNAVLSNGISFQIGFGKEQLSGIANVLPTYLYNASGNIVLVGTISFVIGSGSLLLSNTASVKPTYLYTGIGNIVLSGAVAKIIGVGQLSLSGSATVVGPSSFTATGSGNISLSGTFAVHNANGNLQLSGSASLKPTYLYPGILSFEPQLEGVANVLPTYLYKAAGTIQIVGASTNNLTFTPAPSGKLTLANTNLVSPSYLYTAIPDALQFSGTITIGALKLKNYSATLSTTELQIQGVATATGPAASTQYNGSGNISLSGSSLFGIGYLAGGNISLSGVGNVKPSYLYFPIGNIQLQGTSSLSASYLLSALGNLNVTGLSIDSLILGKVASGNINLQGIGLYSEQLYYNAFGIIVIGNTLKVQPTYLYKGLGIVLLSNTSPSKVIYKPTFTDIKFEQYNKPTTWRIKQQKMVYA